MQEFTIPRTGDMPLKFKGKLLAKAGQDVRDVIEQQRWHTLELYELPGGGYVAAIHWHSCWDNESKHCAQSEQLYTIRELREFFRCYDCLRYFVGPPKGHAKRELIETRIRIQYEEAISELFEKAELAEEVE